MSETGRFRLHVADAAHLVVRLGWRGDPGVGRCEASLWRCYARDLVGRLHQGEPLLYALSPRRKFAYEVLQHVADVIHAVLKLHHASVLFWRWYVLVLAIEVVLSTKLTWSGFVALLLPGSTVVTGLRGANLLAPYCLAT